MIWSSSVIKNSKNRNFNKFIIKWVGVNGLNMLVEHIIIYTLYKLL